LCSPQQILPHNNNKRVLITDQEQEEMETLDKEVQDLIPDLEDLPDLKLELELPDHKMETTCPELGM
jgi:hypothetical protein